MNRRGVLVVMSLAVGVCGGGLSTFVAAPAVLAAPSITKEFVPPTIVTGEVSTLRITIAEPSGGVLVGNFDDVFPAGMVVAAVPAVTTCRNAANTAPATITDGGGTALAVGDTGIRLPLGSAIPTTGCTIEVPVTSATAGALVNTTGSLVANSGVAAPASATLTATPSTALSKAFDPASVVVGDSTTMTVSIDNFASSPRVLSAFFADTFPASMTLRSATVATTCLNASGTAPAVVQDQGGSTTGVGDTGIRLPVGSTIPAGGCTITATVSVSAAGTTTNTTGSLSTTDGFVAPSASAQLNAVSSVGASKSFDPSTVVIGDTSTMTIEISNASSTPRVLSALFNDTFPAGMEVAAVPATTTCRNATDTGPAPVLNQASGALAVGSTGVRLAAGSIVPAGGCSIEVQVRMRTATAVTNTTGTVTTTDGNVAPAASADLSATPSVSVAKSFSPSTVITAQQSTMTITIDNASDANRVLSAAFNDTFPTQIRVAAVPATTTCLAADGVAPAVIQSNSGTALTVNAPGVRLPTGSQIPAAGCTITVQVTSTTTGTFTNTTGTLTTSDGNVAPAASATLTATNSTSLAKSFSPASILTGQTSTMTIQIGNLSGGEVVASAAFNDTFPSGMTVSAVPATTTCLNAAGTAPAVIQSSAGAALAVGAAGVRLPSGSRIPDRGCTITVDVRTNGAGTFTNTTGTLTTSDGNVAGAASAPLVVTTATSLAKSFSPATIVAGDTTTMTISIGNAAAGNRTINAAFNDTFPSGMRVAAVPATTTCLAADGVTPATVQNNSGAALALNAPGIRLPVGTLIPPGGCTITVTIGTTTTGTLTNTTGTLGTGDGAVVPAASAPLVVTPSVSTTKAFGPTSVPVGATSTMTITIANHADTSRALSAAFNDTFPAQLRVATAPATTTCLNAAGTAPAVIQSDTGAALAVNAAGIRLPAGSVIPADGCTITVGVRGTSAGTWTNTTGTLTTTDGTIAPATSAALTVVGSTSVSKGFDPPTIVAGDLSTLTITIDNNAGANRTLSAAFTDAFPTQIQVAAVPASTTCLNSAGTGPAVIQNGSGAALAVGNTGVRLPSGSIVPAAGCTITVSVRTTAPGTYTNTTGTLSTADGNVAPAASAPLTSTPSVSLDKTIVPDRVNAGEPAMLTINFDNAASGNRALSAVFNDAMPAGMRVAAPLTASTTCRNAADSGPAPLINGTGVALAPGSTTIRLAAGTIVPADGCSLSVLVDTTTTGTFTNTTSTATFTDGTVAPAASAPLAVEPSIAVAKAFDPETVLVGDPSTLTIEIANLAEAPRTLSAAFTDTFPTGVVVHAVPVTTTCLAADGVTPATIQDSSGTALAAGDAGVRLPAGSVIPASGCTIVVQVRPNTINTFTNTTTTLTTSDGNVAPAATATLTSTAPVSVAKAFNPGSILTGETAELTITIGNQSSTARSLSTAFNDVFPTGMTVAAIPATTTCLNGAVPATIQNSGGTALVVGSNGIRLPSGSSIPPGGCTITVTVRTNAKGTFANTTTTLSYAGGTAPAATASLVVEPALEVSKEFAPPTIVAGQTSTLTITIGNSSTTPRTLSTFFNDVFPTGMTVAAVPATTTCLSGAVPATIQDNSGTALGVGDPGIRLPSGSTVPVEGCTITVSVRTNAKGTFNNTTSTLTTSDGGVAVAASAALVVEQSLTLAKEFAPPSIQAGSTSTMTITIDNAAAAPRTLSAAFNDVFPTTPSAMTVASLPATTTCLAADGVTPAVIQNSAGAALAVGAVGIRLPSGSTIPAAGCTITVTVRTAGSGNFTNTTATLTTTDGNIAVAASAELAVAPNTALTKSFEPAATVGQQPTTMTITIANTAGSPQSVTTAFNDTFPTQMVVASVPASTTCLAADGVTPATIQNNSGGALAAGAPGIRLPAGSIIPAAGCSITVQVRGVATAGTFTNTTSTLVTANGSVAPAASAPLTIGAGLIGRVFDDVNGNGVDNTDPGLPGAYVVLANTATGECTVAQTDATGAYAFPVTSGVAYTVYETYGDPGVACPPTAFTQPPGSTISTAIRTRSFTAAFNNVQSFGHHAAADYTQNGECTTDAYQSVVLGDGPNLLRINLVTGQVADLSTTAYFGGAGTQINALAMNEDNRLLYAISGNEVVVIYNTSPQPTGVSLGAVPGLPSAFYSNGEIIDGYLYFQDANATTRITYTVDVDPNRPTYMRLVEATNLTQLDTAPLGVTVTGGLRSIDFAAGEDGFLYGASGGFIRRLDPVTGAETSITPAGAPATLSAFAAETNFGAAYTATSELFPGGYVYFGSNTAPGLIYRYNVTANSIESFSQTNIGTSSNDGARCRLPLVFEGGDAPDIAAGTAAGTTPDYRTRVADDGPRHQIPQFTTPTVLLGAAADAEEDAQANATATGDDLNGTTPDDEDGVTFPPLTLSATAGTTYTATVSGINASAEPAAVVCFADWDRNGVFNLTNERALATSGLVTGGTGAFTTTVSWTLPAGFTPVAGTDYFVRCRISTDNADTTATPGTAGWRTAPTPDGDGRGLIDGEVEDYRITVVEQLDTTKAVTTVNGQPATQGTVVYPGDVIGYTIAVTNTGGAAATTTLTETVPLHTTYTGTAEGWTCAGITAGSSCTRDVTAAPGSTATATFTVTVDSPLPLGTSSIANVVTSSNGSCSSCTTDNPVAVLDTVKTVDSVNGAPATEATVVGAGDQVRYRIRVTNTGSGPGTTTLGELVPADTTYSGSGEGWSCAAGAPAGSSCTRTVTAPALGFVDVFFTVTINTPLPSGVATVANAVTSSEGTCSDCTVSNPTGPQLDTVKMVASVNGVAADETTQVGPGDVIVYNVVTTNTGGTEGTTTLTDVVPENTTYTGVDEEWSCAAGSPAGTECTQDVTVAAGASVPLTYTVTVVAPLPAGTTSIANLVTSSDGTCSDCDPANPTEPVLDTIKAVVSVNGAGADETTQVGPGDVIAYSIITTNTGGSAATTELSDVVPANTTYTGTSQGWACADVVAGSSCTQQVAVPAGGSVTVAFTVSVNDPIAAGVTAIANVVTSSVGTCSDCTVSNPTEPQLDTVKTVASVNGVDADETTQVGPGDVIVYDVVTTNTGGTESTTTLTDVVPSNTTYTGVDEDWSCAAGSPAGTECTQDVTVAAGASVPLTFTVTVVDPLPAGTTSIANVVTSSGGTCSNCDPSNPTEPVLDTVKTILTVNGAAPDGSNLLGAGDVIVYSIVTTNTGGSTGTTTLHDAVPANTTYVGTGEGWVCTPDTSAGSDCTQDVTVAAGASSTLTYTVEVVDPLPPGVETIANLVTSTGGTCSNCDPEYPTPPNLDTTKVVVSINGEPADAGDIVGPGDTIVYRIVTTNTGGALATTTLEDIVPANTTYTGTGEGWTCASTAAGGSCDQLVAVAPGGTSTLFFTLTVADPIPAGVTTIGNVVTSSDGTCSACEPSNPTEPQLDTTKVVASVNGVPPLPTTVVGPGDTITYLIETTNTGGSAGETTLEDVVPAQTTYTGSGEGWSCVAPAATGTSCSQVVAVPAGGSTPVFFTLTVADPIPDGVTTIANSVTSTDGTCSDCDPVIPTEPKLDTTKVVATVNGAPVEPDAELAAGDVIVYDVVTTNTGGTAGTTTLTDEVPANTTYTGTGEGWTCTPDVNAGSDCTQIVTVPAGGSVPLTFTVTVVSPLPAGVTSIANLVTSTGGTCSDCNPIYPTGLQLDTVKTVASVNGVDADESTVVGAGDVIVYEIVTTNTGGSSGTTTLSDEVPANTTYSGAAGEGWSCLAGSPAATPCTRDVTVASGGSSTVTFTVTVVDPIPAGVTSIANVVTSSNGTCSDCDPSNPTEPQLDTTKVVASVNGVDADESTVVGAGDVVVYEIVTTNTGGSSGTTTLSDEVPANTTYTGVGENWSCAAPTAGSDCTQVVTVAPGVPVMVSFTVTVVDPIPAGVTQIANVVTSSNGTCSDCDPSNPTEPQLDTVKTVASVNGVDADESTVVGAGDVIVYEIVTTNTGGTPGTTTLTDEVPANTTYTGAGEGWTCTPDVNAGSDCTQDVTVAPGVPVMVLFTVTVNTPVPAGVTSIANVVTSTGGTCSDCDPSNPVESSLDTVKSVASVNGVDADESTVVGAGDVIVYEIVTTNTGGTAASTTLSDEVPANTTYTGAAGEGWSCLAGSPAATPCTRDVTVAPGGSSTVTFTVTVVDPVPAGVTSIANVVTSTGGTCSDCDPSNPTEPVLDTVKLVASVNGVDADESTIVGAGDVVVYEIVTTNTGGTPGTTTLSDEVPASTTYTGVDEGWTCTPDVNAGSDCTQDVTVAPGVPVMVSFTVTVNTPLPAGVTSIANVVTSSDGDCSDCTVSNPTEPVLDTVKSVASVNGVDADESTIVGAGDVIVYEIVTTNTGGTAGTTTLLDEVPANTTYTGVGENWTCAAPTAGSDCTQVVTVAPGVPVMVSFTVTVNTPLPAGVTSIANVVTSTGGTCSDCDPSNPVAEPLIVVEKAADPASGTIVGPGEQIMFRLTFSNTGTGAGTVDYTDVLDGVLDDAVVTDGPTASPAGLLVVSAIAGDRFSVSGSLPAGTTVTVSYLVTVSALGAGDGVLRNFVVEGDDEPPAECLPTDSLCTEHPTGPALNTVKSVASVNGVDADESTVVGPGDVIVYEIVTTNTGGSSGTTTLSDDVPANTTYSGAVGEGWSCVDGSPAATPCTRDVTVAPGGSSLVSFTVTVVDPVPAGVTSIANVVTSSDGDCSDCTVSNPTDGSVSVDKSDPTVTFDPDTGIYTLVYEIVVTNLGGSTTYDLTDSLLFGDGVTPGTPVTVTVDQSGIDPNDTFDGVGQTTIVNDVAIVTGTPHTYTVTVPATVDAATLTTERADCTLSPLESGTGFLNSATVTTVAGSDTDTGCAPVPAALLTIDKTVTAAPVDNGDGTYGITYEIVVTNEAEGPGTYDLTDSFTFGDGVTIVDAEAENTEPGTVGTNPDFDGEGDETIATDVPIAGLGVHVYTVTVTADVTTLADTDGLDCDVTGGEDGSGFLNTATIEFDASTLDDEACVPIPAPAIDIAKSVVDGPTRNSDGSYTIVYEIDVTNSGAGWGAYTLTDDLLFPVGVTVTSATATNTVPGGLPTGNPPAMVTTPRPLGPNGAHTYTVTVDAEVDPALPADERACTPGNPQAATGFQNLATITVLGADDTAAACVPIPPAVLTVTKSVVGDVTVAPDGSYTRSYEVVVANTGQGPGVYDLSDTLQFGDGITIATATVTDPDGNPVAGWNGQTSTVVTTGRAIDAVSSETWTVVVTGSIAGVVSEAAGDCSLDPGETGTGFLNQATMTFGDVDTSDDACAPEPDPNLSIDKTAQPPMLNADGTYTLTYDITVGNTGDAGSYDLSDTLQFGGGITIDSAVVATVAGPTPASTSWDGVADTVVVTGVLAPAGAVHSYRVVVIASAVGVADDERDCVAGAGGSGFANTATLTAVEILTDTACEPVPPASLALTKTVTSGPTPNGNGTFGITYAVTVVNSGTGPTTYDLDDTLQFGAGVNVIAASVTGVSTRPSDVLGINPAWDGVSDTLVVADQGILATTTHTYTVNATVDLGGAPSPTAADCTVDPGEEGTGLRNTASLNGNGQALAADDCEPTPPPVLDVTKTVTSGPTPVIGGYQVVYRVTVANTGPAPGAYTLTDAPHFGDGITIGSATVASADGATPAPNGAWNGATEQTVVADTVIAAGATHTYTFTIVADVAPTITADAADCIAGGDGTSSGFMNTALLVSPWGDDDATACVPAPQPELAITKTAGALVPAGETGVYTLTYTITVANPGTAAGVYDLADDLMFGAGVVVRSATAANTVPGDVVVNASFNGKSERAIASGVGIAAGASHTYTVTVTVETAAITLDTAFDCSLDPGEAGTGLLNRATATPAAVPPERSGAVPLAMSAVSADACVQVPKLADLELMKVASATTVTLGGTLGYTITLTNHGPHTATGVEITDTLPAGLLLNQPTLSPSLGTAAASGQSITWTVGTLAAGQSVTLGYEVVVNAMGNLVNVAEVTKQNEPDPNSHANNHDPNENDQDDVAVQAVTPPPPTTTPPPTTPPPTTPPPPPSPSPSLPGTGGNSGMPVTLGLILLAGGVALILLGRRRRRAGAA